MALTFDLLAQQQAVDRIARRQPVDEGRDMVFVHLRAGDVGALEFVDRFHAEADVQAVALVLVQGVEEQPVGARGLQGRALVGVEEAHRRHFAPCMVMIWR